MTQWWTGRGWTTPRRGRSGRSGRSGRFGRFIGFDRRHSRRSRFGGWRRSTVRVWTIRIPNIEVNINQSDDIAMTQFLQKQLFIMQLIDTTNTRHESQSHVSQTSGERRAATLNVPLPVQPATCKWSDHSAIYQTSTQICDWLGRACPAHPKTIKMAKNVRTNQFPGASAVCCRRLLSAVCCVRTSFTLKNSPIPNVSPTVYSATLKHHQHMNR